MVPIGKMGQEVAKKARITEGVEVFGGVDVKDSGDNFSQYIQI